MLYAAFLFSSKVWITFRNYTNTPQTHRRVLLTNAHKKPVDFLCKCGDLPPFIHHTTLLVQPTKAARRRLEGSHDCFVWAKIKHKLNLDEFFVSSQPNVGHKLMWYYCWLWSLFRLFLQADNAMLANIFVCCIVLKVWKYTTDVCLCVCVGTTFCSSNSYNTIILCQGLYSITEKGVLSFLFFFFRSEFRWISRFENRNRLCCIRLEVGWCVGLQANIARLATWQKSSTTINSKKKKEK